MSQANQRPKALWNEDLPAPSVDAYLDTYNGEFDIDQIVSDYPDCYYGKASTAFRLVTKMDDNEAEERFEGKGIGCWALKRDRSLNNFTADLLAAADALGGKLATNSTSAHPGGIGADSGRVWVAILDGGVGVEVVLWEHQYTNRMKARQRTTIRGPRAYRALLELLGFDWISRKLPGEKVAPNHGEITTMVNDLQKTRIP